MSALFFIIMFGVLPLFFGYQIAKGRNRSGWKALIVVLFFGWFGVLGLALTLKTRDPVTQFLR